MGTHLPLSAALEEGLSRRLPFLLKRLPPEMSLLLSPLGKPERNRMAMLGIGPWILPSLGCRMRSPICELKEVFLSHQ